MRAERLGLVAPVAVVLSVALVVVAERRAGVSPVDGGYLSDLGAPGNPGASAYLLGLAVGALAFLGTAGALVPRWRWRDPRVLLLLGGAAALLAQTVVRCEGDCRLPVSGGGVPLADLAHFAVAGAGFALWAAVPALDGVDPDPVVPRASRVVAATLVGHLAVLGMLVVVDPYGGPAAFLQRTMVLVVLGWVALAGVVAATGRRGRA